MHCRDADPILCVYSGAELDQRLANFKVTGLRSNHERGDLVRIKDIGVCAFSQHLVCQLQVAGAGCVAELFVQHVQRGNGHEHTPPQR